MWGKLMHVRGTISYKMYLSAWDHLTSLHICCRLHTYKCSSATSISSKLVGDVTHAEEFVSPLPPRDSSSSSAGLLPPLQGRGRMPQTWNHHAPKTPPFLKKPPTKPFGSVSLHSRRSLYFRRGCLAAPGFSGKFPVDFGRN